MAAAVHSTLDRARLWAARARATVACMVRALRRRDDRQRRRRERLRPRLGVHRFVAAVADLELDHHVVVLVDEVVAVHHVFAALAALAVAEPRDHSYRLALTHVGDVLGPLLVGTRRLPVARQDL